MFLGRIAGVGLITSRRIVRRLSKIRDGVFLVTIDGAVQYMNDEARRIIDEEDGIVLEGGRLKVRDHQTYAGLLRKIASVAGGDIAGANIALSVERGPGRIPYSVLICSTDNLDGLRLRGVPLVVVTDPVQSQLAPLDLFYCLNGLTNAEARLAHALFEGATLSQAAKAFGVSFHTVRSQLQSIFSKIGVKRQIELIRILSSYVGTFYRSPQDIRVQPLIGEVKRK